MTRIARSNRLTDDPSRPKEPSDHLSLDELGLDEMELDRDFHPEADTRPVEFEPERTRYFAPEDAEPGAEERDLEPPEGELVLGAVHAPPGYALQDQIGEGGMGVVYRAVQLTLDRVVAIKFLREGLLGVAAEDQFFGEARSMAKLRHPNVVQVYDAGAVEGRPYLAMDYVEGRSFSEIVGASGDEDVPIRQAFQWVAEACRGVDYCNRQGLVHCDINPRNIMVDAQGHPYVMDFGIARALGTVTRDTVRDYGTPAYLAPERLRNGAVIDARTDVYALGAVLYFLVTGRHPFTGRTARAILSRVQDRNPIPPRVLNPRLSLDAETIIQKAMEKDPAERYETVEELREEIERMLNGEAIRARRSSLGRRVGRFIGRHRAAVSILAVALCGFIAVGVYSFALLQHSRDLERQIEASDRTIRELQQRYEITILETRAVAAEKEDRIEELRAAEEEWERQYAGLRREFLTQSDQVRELLRQKDELLRDRAKLLARRATAQKHAEERMARLLETSAAAKEIADELAQAQAVISEQEAALFEREELLQEQTAQLEKALEAKQAAVVNAQKMIDQEIERETETLLEMLEDPNSRTRLLAIDKLARRGDPKTLEALTEVVAKSSSRDSGNTMKVRIAALRALGRFARPKEARYRGAWLEFQRLLVKLLDDKHPELRREALLVMGAQLDPPEVPHIGKLTTDRNVDVASAAIQVLVQSGRRDAVPHVLKVLDRSHEPSVLAKAADAVSRLAPGDESVARRLRALLRHEEELPRIAGVQALVAFPDVQSARVVGQMEGDPGVRVRSSSVATLAGFVRVDGQPAVKREAIEGLLRFLNDDTASVATAADQALRQATGKSIGWRYEHDSGERRKWSRKWKSALR